MWEQCVEETGWILEEVREGGENRSEGQHTVICTCQKTLLDRKINMNEIQARNVARTEEMRNAYRNLVGKPGRKKQYL
jgi:hypothetical protein